MGMDAVEIVISAEEAFDIHIQNEEAEKILTPRQLVELVQTKVATTTSSVCMTHRAFNLLRRSLLKQLEIERAKFTPTAMLENLIPRKRRLEILSQTTNDLGIKAPPALSLSAGLWFLVLTGSLSVGLWFAVCTAEWEWGEIFPVVLIATVIVGLIVLTALLRPLQTTFPKSLRTAGDLAHWVMANKPDLAIEKVPMFTKEQIEAKVRDIIVEVLGCKPDFSLDARFIEDLGLS